MDNKSLAQSMKEYLDKYVEDKFPNDYVNIDWLKSDGVGFSISSNPLGQDGLLSADVVGNRIMSYSTTFNVMFPYSQDLQVSIENSLFFEGMTEWIEDNNKKKVYPDLREGFIPIGVYIQMSPFLSMVDPSNEKAQYTIIVQLMYKKGR